MRVLGDTGEAYLLQDPPTVGGEAVVYRALAESDGREVAVKVARQPGSAGRWVHAQAGQMARLASDADAGPAVAPIWDAGTWEDRPFAVLEWYPALLHTWAAEASLDGRRAACLALVRAVAGLHRAGVVHGDLKPANAAVVDEGQWVVLLDFASPGQLALTPRYAAPERLRGGPPSASADRYAVGLIVAELLLRAAVEPPIPATARLALDAIAPDLGVALAACTARRWRRAASLARVEAALAGRPLRRRRGLPLLGGAVLLAGLAARGLASPADCPVGFAIDGTACAHPDGRRLVRVPAGRFTMGRAEPGDAPLHEVRISRAFWIGEAEVTQAEWAAVTGHNPVATRDQVVGQGLHTTCRVWEGYPLLGEQLPVVCVSFLEVVGWLGERSRLDGLQPAYTVTGEGEGTVVHVDPEADGWRLPTEAEWEWAARGAGRGAEWSGARCGANVRDRSAPEHWGNEAPCADGHPVVASVRAYPPSPLGLYGMQGNALEWVWDLYGPLPSGGTVRDPQGAITGAARVLRGGSWNHVPRGPDARYSAAPTDHNYVMGFRVARTAR